MEAANNNSKCPICNKATEVKYKPFCSARCADIDLGRWLKESYVIPGEAAKIPNEEDDADQY